MPGRKLTEAFPRWFFAIPAKRHLAFALGAAAVLRVLWALVCANEPVSDQFIYHEGAVSIASGRGFSLANGDPIGFWPVGYSGALGGVYRLFWPSYGVAFGFNLVLGLASVVAVFFLARQLYDDRAARIAVWIAAVYPTSVLYTTVIASENLYIPLLLFGTLAAVCAFQPRRFGWIVLAGLLFGAVALVRPTGFTMPVAVLVAGLLQRAGVARALGGTAIVAALVLAVCVPWGLRNRDVFGKFELSAFNGGPVLWMGNHPGSNGLYADMPAEFMKLPVAKRDKAMRQVAVDFIVHNPGQFVKLAGLRLFHTLKSETIAAAWNVVGITKGFGAPAVMAFKVVCTLAYGIVMLAVVAAAATRVRLRRASHQDLLVAVLLVLLAVPFVVVCGMDRYHLPLVPLLIIIAADWMARLGSDAGSAVATEPAAGH